VVGVACYITRNVVTDLAGGVTKGVPDGRPLVVLVPRAVDLESTGGDAETELGRKLDIGHTYPNG
jgi:hypothetical protein